MSNLKQLAIELLEKAGKATPGPWKKFQVMFEASLPSGGDFEQTKIDADYIAAASPDVIAALAKAYLEAVELAELVSWYEKSDVRCNAVVEEKARAWLAAWGGEK